MVSDIFLPIRCLDSRFCTSKAGVVSQYANQKECITHMNYNENPKKATDGHQCPSSMHGTCRIIHIARKILVDNITQNLLYIVYEEHRDNNTSNPIHRL